MPKKCALTGKKTRVGRSYSIRGIAKKKKGIGLNITGKTKRKFYPNLVTKRLWFDKENRFIKLKLSTAALRTVNKLGIEAVIRKIRRQGKKI